MIQLWGEMLLLQVQIVANTQVNGGNGADRGKGVMLYVVFQYLIQYPRVLVKGMSANILGTISMVCLSRQGVPLKGPCLVPINDWGRPLSDSGT